MTSCLSGAPEERGWGAAPEAIALVRPLVIVGLHERLETALQGRAIGEVTAAKGHAPVAPAGSCLGGVRRTRWSRRAAAWSAGGGRRARGRPPRTPPWTPGPPRWAPGASARPARRRGGG